ncbi:MAG: alpha/beta hydrolase [Saprospiraceae bacterium]|nr:alpha/beta hydrolase [Saprospiraceae bacterium]
MTLQQWRDTGKTFRYKAQYDIFFQEAGAGENLLLLHGFPTASRDWHKIWAGLRERFHVLAPDFIGFGYSDKPGAYPYSIIDQADLIEALLENRGITATHVLAHDYGDTVFQELLARFIDRKQAGGEGLQLYSATLLNGGLFPETHRPRPIQRALISPIGPLLTPLLSKASLSRNFHHIFGKNTRASEQEIGEFYELMVHKGGKSVFHKLIRYMEERRRYRERWVGALQNSPIPIRLINGAADPVSGRHMTERYKALTPDPDVVMLEEIGHYPQTEAPEAVLRHFLEFAGRQ